MLLPCDLADPNVSIRAHLHDLLYQKLAYINIIIRPLLLPCKLADPNVNTIALLHDF